MIGVASLIYLGYFLPRNQDVQVQILYFILFCCYLILNKHLVGSAKTGIYIAIIFRAVLLFSIPALSDDIYRFIWDGRLLAAGINPFDQIPEFYMQNDIGIPGINLQLFELLNFKIYHTMYPPLAQFTGWIAVLIGGDSIFWTVFVMRLFAFSAEIGSILLIYKLLGIFKLKSSNVLIYGLNPLVILELAGNLHHEVYVVFFMLLAIWFYKTDKFIPCAIAVGLAVGSKLIPLIFLPLFISRFGIKKSVLFFGIVGLSVSILFFPFFGSQLINANASSGWLYFQKFEFNGSIYYLVREIGFWVKGYNIIQSSGRWLALITLVSIMAYSWFEAKRKVNLPEAFMWVLTLYLVFATTVHPWYIIPLIAFCTFSNYRYPVVWSYFIFWSYAGYTKAGYEEPILLIAVEYFVVYVVMFYEIYTRTRLKKKSIRLS